MECKYLHVLAVYSRETICHGILQLHVSHMISTTQTLRKKHSTRHLINSKSDSRAKTTSEVFPETHNPKAIAHEEKQPCKALHVVTARPTISSGLVYGTTGGVSLCPCLDTPLFVYTIFGQVLTLQLLHALTCYCMFFNRFRRRVIQQDVNKQ